MLPSLNEKPRSPMFGWRLLLVPHLVNDLFPLDDVNFTM
jgi:hypothetical protein